MLSHLWEKMKEAMVTIIPVILIVLVISFTPLFNMNISDYYVFIISAIFIILGIGLFSLGAEMSMEPMGEALGTNMMKTNKIFVMLAIVFVLTSLITVVEPDVSELLELAEPLLIDGRRMALLIVIGVSTGLFLIIGIYRLMKDLKYKTLLIFFYMLMFAIICLIIINSKEHLLPLALDSGGVTTGAISTPFIMAIGIGAAMTIGGRKTKANSFGFIALCSVGPIIGALILVLFNDNAALTIYPDDIHMGYGEGFNGIMSNVFHVLGKISLEVLIGLGLVSVAFIVINYLFLKLPRKRMIQIFVGIIYSFIGSVLFLTAASIGFHTIGFKLGESLSNISPVWVCIISFLIGVFVVLAEPAVHLLSNQVEEITLGGVSKKSILIALSIGAGISVVLSIIRIIFDFSIIYYIVGGFVVSFLLSLFVPSIYTAIAFDAGGVASGPITLSFIMPLALGACMVLQPNDIAEAAFGIVAMVAMTPVIAIQLLGFRDIVKKKQLEKARLKTITTADDEQIIEFR